jgi:hypothetical protein
MRDIPTRSSPILLKQVNPKGDPNMSEHDQKQSHGTQEEWKKQQGGQQQGGQQQGGQKNPQSDREKFEKDPQKKPA